MRINGLILSLLALVLGPSSTWADDLLPATLAVEQAVDLYVDAQLQETGVQAAAQADDANLIRRLTLDLDGRIPTLEETRTFVASTQAGKRVELIERLMSSPAFVRHQATQFDTMLMNGTRGSVRPYLLTALSEGRSWDRIYRDLMMPDESDPKLKSTVEFLRQRVRDLDKLTAEVSSIFFGVNVSCARCHDHPLVADWKQDHFFGMKSFFSRTYESGGRLAERETGVVKFKTTKGVERQARLMFLTGKVVETDTLKEAPASKTRKTTGAGKELVTKNSAEPPPKFSARAELVKLSLEPDQRTFFARSIANRIWHRFFGYGLVMPLDQMHSENAPSHPDLLDWLARDLVEHQYDLRRLIRGLVLSRAYGRDSRWDKGDAPPPSLFAVARVRPLTPMQLAVSLRLAVSDPQALKPEEFDKRLQGLEASASGLARRFDQPGDDFQVGVSEALLFSNGAAIEKDLLAEGGDRLLNRLKKLNNKEEAIDLAVRAVLCRPPREEERKLLGDYLKQRADRPAEALRQMLWALLTSAEFRFNY
jgi:hypothetical protein